MNSKFRTAAVAALLIVPAGLAACTPVQGGGGGGTDPGPSALALGCFEVNFPSVVDPRVKISGSVVLGAWTYTESVHYTADCSDPAVSGPIRIYPGIPDAADAEFCRSSFGPEATTNDFLSELLIPSQIYWGCNYPL